MKLKFFFHLSLFTLLHLPTLTHATVPYDYLAGSIVSQAKFLKNKKIAVLPPVYMGKGPSSTPEIVAERLTTGIVKKGAIQVIERGLMSKLLSEANHAMTGVIEEAAGQNVGKILKVDAIRLITADEGKVLVATGKTVDRTWPQFSDLNPAKVEEALKTIELASQPPSALALPPPTVRAQSQNRTAYLVGSKHSSLRTRPGPRAMSPARSVGHKFILVLNNKR